MKSAPVPFTTLLAGLSDPRSEVRKQNISTIMRLAALGQALPHFLILLNDPDEKVRSSAINALGSLGDLRALPDLGSLASLGDAHALPPLRALLAQGNSETAETSLAEQAIALLEQPEA